MLFSSHKQIPAKYRRIILEESLQTRVNNLTLETCNAIIEEYLKREEESSELKIFTVNILKDNQKRSYTFQSIEDVYVLIDKEMNFESISDSFCAIVYQADRMMKAFINKQWIYPKAKDYVKISKMVKA